MASKTLSQIIGGGYPARLAVETDYPKDKADSVAYTQIGAIDASAALTEVLGLTGRFVLSLLQLAQLLANNIGQIKLTVDGVVIWDVDPLTNSDKEYYVGCEGSHSPQVAEQILVNSSLSFEVKMDSDTSITVSYLARPIL